MLKKKYDFVGFKGPSLRVSSEWTEEIKKYLEDRDTLDEAIMKLNLFGKKLSKKEEKLWKEIHNVLE